jgi:glycosyltransferase involved in cell wall biosynthesis
MDITAAILTKNEENTIEKCLQCLEFTQHIIVLDESTDATTTIIKKARPDAIIYNENIDSFAEKRNFLLSNATTKWVLYIDADEEVSTDLQKEIAQIIDQNDSINYALPRQDIFWNKKILYGDVLFTRLNGIVRLVQKDSGQWQGSVHEVFESKLLVKKLSAPLYHYPHQTIASFLEHINTYSTIKANELYDNNIKEHPLRMIVYPIGKFLYTYFLLLGFLDGAEGFVYAFMMSFHSFLVRAKLQVHNTQ